MGVLIKTFTRDTDREPGANELSATNIRYVTNAHRNVGLGWRVKKYRVLSSFPDVNLETRSVTPGTRHPVLEYCLHHSLLNTNDVESERRKTARVCHRIKSTVKPPFTSTKDRGMLTKICFLVQERTSDPNTNSRTMKQRRRDRSARRVG